MHPQATATDFALRLAALGCQVFRIKSGTKDFFIDKQWAENPLSNSLDVYDAFTRPDGSCAGYNYGVNAGKSDLLILDIDCKGDVDGFANLATLGGIPKTFTVKTPSGGVHYYFRAGGAMFGQADIAPGVQVRSYHGFVVGPGSRTVEIRDAATGAVKQYAGVYEVTDDSDFAPLPAWVAEKAKPLGDRPTKPGAALFEPDSDDAVKAARDYVRSLPPAPDGGRNMACCDAARWCLDFGCSPEMAFEILSEEFRTRSPMDPSEIEGICDRILATYIGPIGKELASFGFEPVEIEPADFENDPDDMAERAARFALGVTAPRISEADEREAPLRPWLIKKRLLSGKISELVAPGGAGKSLLTLQWACALGIGSDEIAERLGCEITKQCRVLVMNNEDELDELERRLAAVARHFNLDRDAISKNVFLRSGAENPLIVMERESKGKLKRPEAVKDLVAYVRANNIGAIFVDPLVEFHEANENDNAEMSNVMRCWRKVANKTGAAVLIVHHTRKPGLIESAGSADAGRGASAVINAARAAATLFTMGDKDAEKYGIAPDRRHLFVRLDDCKANLTLASPFAEWFERKTVTLTNGENVGVLQPVELTNAESADAPVMAAILAPLIQPGERLSVAKAARILADDDAFSGVPAASLAKRIAKAFVTGETLETNAGQLLFEARGNTGGEFSLA